VIDTSLADLVFSLNCRTWVWSGPAEPASQRLGRPFDTVMDMTTVEANVLPCALVELAQSDQRRAAVTAGLGA
jgi:hypothetical protein